MRAWVVLGVTVVVAVLGASCTTGRNPIEPAAPKRAVTTEPGKLRIESLSTRRGLVSGDDVLIGVSGVPDGTQPILSVDGKERPGVLAVVAGGVWKGLVNGLPPGRSTVSARAGGRSGELEVVNHPISGPVLSGPHLEPYACTTAQHGLGDPVDADCTAPTTVTFSYVDGSGAVRPLDDPQNLPGDVMTIDVSGRSVPFVIRTESGTINRAIYWISVLDPTPSSTEWEGVSDGWNENLVYRFGGGCDTTYSQGDAMNSAGPGSRTAPTADPDLLRRGYAVATATLNTFQVACNDVLSAETALMVKEHFIEQYGHPEATIGEGGSGGAIQQFLLAQNYPGLLDALAASAPFPDALSIAPGVTDCGLLQHYYSTAEGSSLSEQQRTAINGHATAGTCATWNASFVGNLDPTDGCALPPDLVYHPATNPTGARCTLQDSNVNQFGRDPKTGFAKRPLDNVGVEYGLKALQDRVIDVGQFLDLNERIGGWDIDGNVVPNREVADASDLQRLYQTGRINQGGGDLTKIPIIVINAFSDPTGDIHDRWRAFEVRERLRVNGKLPTNLSIWTLPGGSLSGSLSGGSRDVRNQQIDALQTWLDNMAEVKHRPSSPAQWQRTLARTQPAAAMNRCVVSDDLTLTGDDVYDVVNSCTHAYPAAGDPRRVAGADLASTAAKCQLRAIQADSYGVALTSEQMARLHSIFPDGVCDWTKPGVAEVKVERTWIDYDRPVVLDRTDGG